MNSPPPVTRALLIAMAIGFLLQQFMGEWLQLWLALWPLGDFVIGASADGLPVSVGFQPWQLITYGFLHNDMMHLFFNALALYQFGMRVEYTLGTKRYAIFFFTCLAGAGLCQLLVQGIMMGMGGSPAATIGASGGVYGLLLAYAMFFPHERVMLLLPPIPMSARTMVIGFGVIELVLGVTGTAAGIAHFAHLGGMLFGWLLLRYWRRKPPAKNPRPPGLRIVR